MATQAFSPWFALGFGWEGVKLFRADGRRHIQGGNGRLIYLWNNLKISILRYLIKNLMFSERFGWCERLHGHDKK
jgi:hypothetical protein